MTYGRSSPGQCPLGVPWFPSEGTPLTSAPSWQGWLRRRRTKGARRGPSGIAPKLPAHSFGGRSPETRRHPTAMLPSQNRQPGRDRFRPAASDNTKPRPWPSRPERCQRITSSFTGRKRWWGHSEHLMRGFSQIPGTDMWAQADDPLTRPAPAGENAGGGPPSPPRGRGWGP